MKHESKNKTYYACDIRGGWYPFEAKNAEEAFEKTAYSAYLVVYDSNWKELDKQEKQEGK